MDNKRIVFIRNYVLAVCFFCAIVHMSIKTKILYNLADIIEVAFVSGNTVSETVEDIGNTENSGLEEPAKITLDDITDNIEELLPYEEKLINLSGTVMKVAGVRSYYNEEYGINVTSDGYIINAQNQTSTDYEILQMIHLKQFLDERGVKLLYVSKPAKYIEDDYYRKEFGGESYLNRNTDLLMERFDDAGIDYVDLRDNLQKENLNCMDLFYRTDHHWNVPAAKWAAEQVVYKLNESYGYNIDMRLYDDENFTYEEFNDCWLGEQGRKIAESYIGLDDFTLVIPNYETSFTRDLYGEQITDNFNLFIDYSTYEDSYSETGEFEPAKLKGWHYSYCGDGYIHNNRADYGNILILGDSYERNMIPFLALGVEDICKIEPRYMESGDVLEMIDSGHYDTVIVCYAQCIIGAHDDPDNANYRAFSFFD